MSRSLGDIFGRLPVQIGTARRLGVGNILRVLNHRWQLGAGIHRAQRMVPAPPPRGPFFGSATLRRSLVVPASWQTTADYFGWHRPVIDNGPPDWHRNVLTGRRVSGESLPWWKTSDFDQESGDIKAVWEASRFDWVVRFSQQAASGNPEALDRLNGWLADWSEKNPPYRGPNWLCGQEASIRVMHLAVAGSILGSPARPPNGLVDLLVAHLRRIAATLDYAVAQDNNHGTSEGAALFIGGHWLEAAGIATGARWGRIGRRLLENRVGRLVQADGSFSQYSVSYHRLMLDTLSLTEQWRRRLGLPGFSPQFLARAAAASRWLRALVDPISGDAPNLGANDGANLLNLTTAGGRDFRPAVHLASTLFEGRKGWAGAGPWNSQLEWLDIPECPLAAVGVPDLFPDGGQAVLHHGEGWALLRFPRFRFRPSHADALHVDLWAGGENLLRDAGSFSYAADQSTRSYFEGARGHNGIQFDDREQMPRLGRFLWGGWLATKTLSPPSPAVEVPGCTASASYDDAAGAAHHRTLLLGPGRLTVTDQVAGFRQRAVGRWRLRPGLWRVEGTAVSDGIHRLEFRAEVPILRCAIVDGWESRDYLQRSQVPVVEVEIGAAGTLVSEYRWAP